MKYMNQCKLTAGNSVTMGWVDSDLAILGKRVSFEKKQDGVVWTVHEVYSRLPKKFVEEAERHHMDFLKKLDRKNERGS